MAISSTAVVTTATRLLSVSAPFLLLGLIPQGIHLAECHVFQRLAYLYAMGLNIVEAADKLGVGLFECRVRVYLLEPCGIDEREEEVAKLISRLFLILTAQLGL